MFTANTFSLLSLAAGSAFGYPAPSKLYQRQSESGLNSAAVAAGKLYFGTALEHGSMTNTEYMTILNNTADFGQLVPANAMKWDTIESSQDSFSYEKGDAIVALAEANGQKMRCHNLVWYNQLPSWVSNGGFDNATLIEILQNHITNEVSHYKGQCYAWDVVNEAISDDGDGSYRSNVFYDTIGEAYIPIAFAAAAAADPDAKLYYNDYSIESAGAKSTAAQNLVKMVQSYGAKIDGVGSQSHLIVGSTPSTDAQVENMKAFTDLGVEVAITELDIRADTPISDSDATQQAADYASTVKACMQVEKCVGITVWDFTDKYSWVPSTFSGTGSALPWDEDLNKKSEVYDAILSALGGSASASGSAKTQSAAVSTSAAMTSQSSSAASVVTSSAVTSQSSSAAPVVTSSAAAMPSAYSTGASSSPAANATSTASPKASTPAFESTGAASSSTLAGTSVTATTSAAATTSTPVTTSIPIPSRAPGEPNFFTYTTPHTETYTEATSAAPAGAEATDDCEVEFEYV